MVTHGNTSGILNGHHDDYDNSTDEDDSDDESDDDSEQEEVMNTWAQKREL